MTQTQPRRRFDPLLILHTASGAFRMATQLLAMMILVPVVIDYLGEERYGIWALSTAVVALLAFLELGLLQSANRFLSSIRYRDEPERCRAMACTAFWLTLIASGAILAVGLPLSRLLAGWLGVPPHLRAEAGAVLTILVVHTALSIPLRNFSALLFSQRFMARAHLAQGSVSVVYVIAAWLALRAGAGLVGLSLVYLGCMLLEHACYIAMVRAILPLSSYLPRNFRRDLVPKILEFALFAWLGQVADVLSMRASVIIVQVTSGLVSTGAFGISNRLSNIAIDISSQPLAAGAPKIAALSAQSEDKRQEAGWLTLSLARRAMLFSGPLAATAIPLGGIFLLGWVGETIAAIAAVPLAILALNALLAQPAYAVGSALNMSGQHRYSNGVALVLVALYVPAAFVGGRWLGGAVGVAWATLGLTVVGYLPVYLRRFSGHFRIGPAQWWRLVVRPHLLPFLVTLAAAWQARVLIEARFEPGRVWLWAAIGAGAVCGVVYLMLYGLFAAPREEREQLRHALKRLRTSGRR